VGQGLLVPPVEVELANGERRSGRAGIPYEIQRGILRPEQGEVNSPANEVVGDEEQDRQDEEGLTRIDYPRTGLEDGISEDADDKVSHHSATYEPRHLSENGAGGRRGDRSQAQVQLGASGRDPRPRVFIRLHAGILRNAFTVVNTKMRKRFVNTCGG